VPLCVAGFDSADIRHLIDRTWSLAGWMILFTHDVTGAPAPFGCKPAQLEAVVAYAAERSTILPVRDVVASLPNFNPFTARCLFALQKLKGQCRRLAKWRRVNAMQ
jgi:hypothetical protein